MSLGEWSHLGYKNSSSKHVPKASTLHTGADSLRGTYLGSSGTVTWSFSQVMMGAGSPSVWHSKRAVPFSSTVWDSGCREKSVSAVMSTVRRESERAITVSTVTQNTESWKPRMRETPLESRVVAKG